MKKWPLLDSNPDICFGSPRIDGMRLTTEHVYQYCTGSDSDAHVKIYQEEWPYVTVKQIKQAIAFEREASGNFHGYFLKTANFLARDFDHRIGRSKQL